MALTALQLKQRSLGIGASESAASIGVSKYTTKLGLYLKKMAHAEGRDIEELDDKSLLITEGGSALEPVILNHFQRTTGLILSDHQLTVRDPANDWRWVTLDARASDGGLVEAKKTEIVGAVWGDGEEDIPDDYYCQTQQGMACTGATFVYVPVLLPRWEFAVYTVKRDDEFIDLMTAQQKDFMRRLVERDPPAPVSLDDCKLAWPKNKALKAVHADQETYDAAMELAVLKKKSKDALELAEKLELRVKAAMMDAELLKGDFGPIATWKNNKDSEKFDKDSFAIAHPALYKEYLKPVPGPRVFLMKLKAV